MVVLGHKQIFLSFSLSNFPLDFLGHIPKFPLRFSSFIRYHACVGTTRGISVVRHYEKAKNYPLGSSPFPGKQLSMKEA